MIESVGQMMEAGLILMEAEPLGSASGIAGSFIMRWARAQPRMRASLRTIAARVGYDTRHWMRVVMYDRCAEFISSLGPENLDVLEISAGDHWRRTFRFGSFTETHYPDFDICKDTLPRTFDVVIADQVFEHVAHPRQAAANCLAMLKEGGYFIVATPFLVPVHPSPLDCSRWTEQGLALLLEDAGFRTEDIRTESWGNRACIVANFGGWKKRGFSRSLANEPDFPVMVWAIARKGGNGA